MKKALIIAYNFPPVLGSSGVQRTLSFVKYLPEYNWQPIILTLKKNAYPLVGDDQTTSISDDVIIKRTYALDAARHLSVKGRYPFFTCLPDRWSSWWFTAVPYGLRLINQHKPNVILSTYPIATAHLVALTLKKITGIKWVADFRDPMTEDDYPPDKIRRKVLQWLERKVVVNCDKLLFTTMGSLEQYKERYKDVCHEKFLLITNGYNEEDFIKAEKHISNNMTNLHERPIMLLHSGMIYSSERNPVQLFEALGELLSEGKINSNKLQLILRGSRNENYCNKLILENGIESIVKLEPLIPYSAALVEMIESDALLILQGSDCNNQVPAKVYEYLRTKKPVLALTDRSSNTANVLIDAGLNWIAPLDSKEEIKILILKFITAVLHGNVNMVKEEALARYNRKHTVEQLASELERLI